VTLAKGMLFVGLVSTEDGLLCHSDRAGSRPELELGCFGRTAMDGRRVGWRVLIMGRWTLHCVVYFSRK
jgi:hypothetical protein